MFEWMEMFAHTKVIIMSHEGCKVSYNFNPTYKITWIDAIREDVIRTH